MQTANHENLRASLAPKDQIQVAAIFENKLMAKKTIQQLANSTDVSTDQVAFIDASDTEASEKLERESRSIGKNLWHSHLLLGGVGFLVGILAAFLLVSFGPELIGDSFALKLSSAVQISTCKNSIAEASTGTVLKSMP